MEIGCHGTIWHHGTVGVPLRFLYVGYLRHHTVLFGAGYGAMAFLCRGTVGCLPLI